MGGFIIYRKVYDFDVMMQRRKEAMARARRKKKVVNYCFTYVSVCLHVHVE